jgi:uncharacterized protein YyaL (SSP411 family)
MSEHTNQLIHETSPYLLQHAHNPVDWFPWGEEALDRARSEDKPIFLSIGYAACHWCHVMEHESFENPEVAETLNRSFVSIKVDREERPDLDDIYMTAVVALTGQGGWPMTVFLAPDLKPFMGGTYFPPEDRWGRIGFHRLISRIAQLWENPEERIKLLQNAEALHDIVVDRTSGIAPEDRDGVLDQGLVASAVRELSASFDKRWAGFGSAPKFPPSTAITTLLRDFASTRDPSSLEMAVSTLDRMHAGGLYDHLAGGFHRYSTDEMWLVPHFEKMLYDNAQLVAVYLDAYQVTSDSRYARVAQEIFDYEMTYMTDINGGIYSTEDADSEGREGVFYLWGHAELEEVLGREDLRVFAARYDIEKAGNFSSPEPYHKGLNILHLRTGLAEVAQRFGLSQAELEQRLTSMRKKLTAARNLRIRPGLDDKIIASWNGLMISAFARGHQVLGEGKYLVAANRAAVFILDRMRTAEGRLLRTYRGGRSRLPAYLEDYAYVAQACLDLFEAGFDPAWIEAAEDLTREMVEQFWDREAYGFYNTGALHENLIMRMKSTQDGAIPSPLAVAVRTLLRLGRLLDNSEYLDMAEQTLKANLTYMRRAPRGHLSLLSCVDTLVSPVKEIAIVGKQGAEDTQRLVQALHRLYLPNRIIAFFDPEQAAAQDLSLKIPLMRGRSLVDGRAAAYVCQNYACQQPVTTPEGLIEALNLTS